MFHLPKACFEEQNYLSQIKASQRIIHIRISGRIWHQSDCYIKVIVLHEFVQFYSIFSEAYSDCWMRQGGLGWKIHARKNAALIITYKEESAKTLNKLFFCDHKSISIRKWWSEVDDGRVSDQVEAKENKSLKHVR